MNTETLACPLCDMPISPIDDNVGCDEPDPTHYELSGYECTNCEYKEDL